MYLGNLFSLIYLFVIFENFWPKRPKNHFWPKFQFLEQKMPKFSKIRNYSKKVRKCSLDACLKTALAKFW